MYHIGICERETQTANRLEQMLQDKYMVKTYQYSSNEELFDEVEEGNIWADIIIMDVNWEKKRGIEIAKELQTIDSGIPIIFSSNDLSEDISDIFEAEPTYLLLKPVQEEKLYAAVDKALKKIDDSRQETMEIHNGRKILRIRYKDIVYLESDRRYLIIHQKKREDRIMMKMSELLEILPDCFLRCHQSYTVNMNEIAKITQKMVIMQNGVHVPISRSKYQYTKEQVIEYFGES